MLKNLSQNNEGIIMDSFREILEEINSEIAEVQRPSHINDDVEVPHFPIADVVAHDVLMHRDVHFGGSFDIMLKYYSTEGNGIHHEFDDGDIEQLRALEKELGFDLAPLILQGHEAEKVSRAKKAYQKLRDVYELRDSPEKHTVRLLADIILSEEEIPSKEIDAIVAEGERMTASLIELLTAEDFYDELFPGYGMAPAFAAMCLGKIGDEKAIRPLFESIGKGDFLVEENIFGALRNLGKPAKEFIVSIVKSVPITVDNERAAMALLQFKDDPAVAVACLEALQGLSMREHPILALHLILACENLVGSEERRSFVGIFESSTTPEHLRVDMNAIIRSWKS